MYNAMLRRREVLISGTSFYIAPFPVFSAARISAQLTKVFSPVLGGLVALLGGDDDEDMSDEENAMKAMPTFTSAMEGLSPAEFEKLARELLVNNRNIAYRSQGMQEAEVLTEDGVNALFAGNVQDMYILAFNVVKINFSGFFEKARTLSGNPKAAAMMEKFGLNDTGNSTPVGMGTSSYGATPL